MSAGRGRERASWDAVWLSIARVMATRSGCVRAQVGAVIVDSANRVVSTAYNGPPAGYVMAPTTAAVSCRSYCPRALLEDGEVDPGYADCPAAHAEMNAVAFVDRRECERGTLYVTGAVCYTCAKTVANSGIGRVVMNVSDGEAHRNPERTIAFLRECGLVVDVLRREEETP